MDKNDPEIRAFGEALGIFRTRAGLTQQQLANKLGMSRRAVAGWELGENLPRTKGIVLQITYLLGLSDGDRTILLKTAGMDPSPIIWTIPFQRNPFYTGREDILNYLQKTLSTDRTVALMQPQALKGLGGIGKTHTAIEYAYRHRDEYQAILWAPATTSSILQASLVSIAMILNLPQKNEPDQDLIVKAVKQWLMNHSAWLLILDNVEDLESIGSLYPWAHSGHVIITTRSQSVGGIALSITLEKMEPEEGALFLLRRAALIGPEEGKEQAKGTDYEKAMELSEVLGGLPLALDQAAAYIEKTRCGLSTYLELYQTQKTKLLGERGSLTTDHPESVTITFSLAFQKVERASTAAGELLQFCALLSPDAIPEEIILNGGTHLGPTLETIVTDLVAFNAAIGMLLGYSLVRRDTDIETGTQILSIHRLVQAVLKSEMDEQTYQQWAERAVRAVNHTFPKIEIENWSRCERYLPHALVCEALIRQKQMIFIDPIKLLIKTADYLQLRARHAEAEEFLKQALTIHEKQSKPEPLNEADYLKTMASIRYAQSRYSEAEEFLKRAMMIYKQQLGPESPAMADCLNDLGALYDIQGKYAEAMSLLKQAIMIYEQQMGTDHPNTATALNNLASVYENQSNYRESVPLYKQALAIREKQLGLHHPYTAQSYHNLAGVYLAQGEYLEAERSFSQALVIREETLGKQHPDIAQSLSSLGSCYHKLGNYTPYLARG